MKIRNNYVSNSSSSSFVVLFGNKEDFDKAILDCVDFIRNSCSIMIPKSERESLVEYFKNSIEPIDSQKDWLEAVVNNILHAYEYSLIEYLALRKKVVDCNNSNDSVSIIHSLSFVENCNQFILLNPEMLKGLMELSEYIEKSVEYNDFYHLTSKYKYEQSDS